MYLICLFLLFLCTPNNFAQSGSIKVKKKKEEKPPVKKDSVLTGPPLYQIYYGYKSFFNDFQKRLNTTNNFRLEHPVQLAGIGVCEHFLISRGGSFYGHVLYNQVIPQDLQINDSISCKITGFVFSIAAGPRLFSKSKKFKLLLYGGFNTGRLRFYQNQFVNQKNPFFSPKVGIQPKLMASRFMITLIFEAEYDVSKLSWRKMTYANSNKIEIDKFRQSGVTMLIGVGYRIFNYTQGSNIRSY